MAAVRAIYGIDFSGAQDAGEKIWIARGVPNGERLLVSGCYRVRDLDDLGKGIDDCVPGMVNLVRPETNAAFVFDFLFGMPVENLLHCF